MWEARALSNRSEIHVARGSLARAERDARSAESLFRAVGQELEATYALHNCGIVTYCQGGYRAAHGYLALRLLGYPRVRNYTGSWKEWGDRTELPVEQ